MTNKSMIIKKLSDEELRNLFNESDYIKARKIFLNTDELEFDHEEPITLSTNKINMNWYDQFMDGIIKEDLMEELEYSGFDAPMAA